MSEAEFVVVGWVLGTVGHLVCGIRRGQGLAHHANRRSHLHHHFLLNAFITYVTSKNIMIFVSCRTR
jgi:UDP-N-acetylmuramyl pentapeptide phosphotransferase/UDP-N-acetylglucosamine-1-phosphate transferase